LANPQNINLRFRSASRGTQISLIQDRNQNGIVDSDEVLQQSVMRPKRDGSLDAANVSAGTYFVQVTKTGKGSSTYQFSLTTAPIDSAASNSNASIIDQIVDLTNAYRQQNGLAPLSINPLLATAAQTHTQNMALQDFVSHTEPDGSTVDQRVSATGYQWALVAENVAAGYPTANAVVQGWINSPGHRANLLNPNVTEIGVGYYFLANDTGSQNLNYYWTQVFGEPQS
jgi:uncharacterized protein YkwD